MLTPEEQVIIDILKSRPRSCKELLQEPILGEIYQGKPSLNKALYQLQKKGMLMQTNSQPPIWYPNQPTTKPTSAEKPGSRITQTENLNVGEQILTNRSPLSKAENSLSGSQLFELSNKSSLKDFQQESTRSAGTYSSWQPATLPDDSLDEPISGSNVHYRNNHTFGKGFADYPIAQEVAQQALHSQVQPLPNRTLVVIDLGNVHDCLVHVENYFRENLFVVAFASKDFNGYGVNPKTRIPIVQGKTGLKGENDVSMVWWLSQYVTRAAQEGVPLRVILVTKAKTILSVQHQIQEAYPGNTVEIAKDWAELRKFI